MSTRNDPNRQQPVKRRQQAAERRARGGDAEQAARRSQGVVAPRAEPSRQGARRQSGDRR